MTHQPPRPDHSLPTQFSESLLISQVQDCRYLELLYP